jgi:hypothetical protein
MREDAEYAIMKVQEPAEKIKKCYYQIEVPCFRLSIIKKKAPSIAGPGTSLPALY